MMVVERGEGCLFQKKGGISRRARAEKRKWAFTPFRTMNIFKEEKLKNLGHEKNVNSKRKGVSGMKYIHFF